RTQCVLYMIRRHTRPPLFPYTTLFRSMFVAAMMVAAARIHGRAFTERSPRRRGSARGSRRARVGRARHRRDSGRTENGVRRSDRSEEHTSELQSRENLVCRLLLEKKKQ